MRSKGLYSSDELERYYLQHGIDAVITIHRLKLEDAAPAQIRKWEQFRERAGCLLNLWTVIKRRNGYVG